MTGRIPAKTIYGTAYDTYLRRTFKSLYNRNNSSLIFFCHRSILHEHESCLWMPARIARSVTTSNSRYICLSCRLQNSTLPRGQIARSQHTGSPANQGTDSTQGFVSKNGENYNDSASPSRIGDILRSFMSKQNEKHKANKGKSGNENQKKTEVRLMY